MTKYLYVEVDTNDADYVATMKEISDEEIEILKPLIEAIKNFKPYKGKDDWMHYSNWPIGEVYRRDLGEKSPEEIYEDIGIQAIQLMEEYIPYNEFGSHTITQIDVVTVLEKLL